MKRVAFATSSDEPDLAADDRLALPALATSGIDVLASPWDSPRAEPRALLDAGVDAVVLRSCWNYHRAEARFGEWLHSLESEGLRVVNPAPLAHWNLSKLYLGELAARGVPVPATAYVSPADPTPLAEVLERHGLDEAVVKPWVSMNGWDTWRVSRASAAHLEPAWRALVGSRGLMVQRYLPEIEREGELSFVFFDGVFSHALRKRPCAGEFRVQVEHGGVREPLDPAAALVDEARSILLAAPYPTVYGRVDGVVVDGRLQLMELEVIDPTLFFALGPRAPARFAAALSRALLGSP
jgi:glutathione synthase/RimK-type ligase-like ATP-grasp enzyme